MLFSDNDTPWLGRRNNEECEEAISIITHHLEPHDDLTTPYRTLMYMPLGIIVRPLAVVVEDLKVHGLPPGCILVKPVTQRGGSTQVCVIAVRVILSHESGHCSSHIVIALLATLVWHSNPVSLHRWPVFLF